MKTARVLIVGLTITLLGSACGSSATNSRGRVPIKRGDNTLRWGVQSTAPPGSIKVVGVAGSCGARRPWIKRPHIQYRDDNVYIRLEKHVPHEKVPRGKAPRCVAAAFFIRRWITLRRNLDEVKIYDNGLIPPQLRWPQD